MVLCGLLVCSQIYRTVSAFRVIRHTGKTFSSSPPSVHLCPSELPPSSLLTLTPSTRLIFRRERFTVQCPVSQSNSSRWMLRRFPPGHGVRNRVLYTDWCSLLGGAVSADTCVFTAASGNSGLYWCEGAEGRSNAVNITVSCESCVTVMLKQLQGVLTGYETVSVWYGCLNMTYISKPDHNQDDLLFQCSYF